MNVKNNNGFTLIELLATILVISLVFSIGFYFVNNVINQSKENTTKISYASINKSANLYGLEKNKEILWQTIGDYSQACVSVDDLINAGYIKEEQFEGLTGIYGFLLTRNNTNSVIDVESIDSEDNVCGFSSHKISIPTSLRYCASDLVYNKQNQLLIKNNVIPNGFYFSNIEGRDAGTYQVVAHLNDDYTWYDDSTEDKVILCSIKKAIPKLNEGFISFDENMSVGETKDIAISFDTSGSLNTRSSNSNYLTGYVNEDSSVTVRAVASRNTSSSLYISFTPDDLTNYYSTTVSYTVKKINATKINVPTTNYCTNVVYNGKEQTLVDIPSRDVGYTLVNTTGTNAGDYEIVAHLNYGFIWNNGKYAGKTSDITFKCKINPEPVKHKVKVQFHLNGGSSTLSTSGNYLTNNDDIYYYTYDADKTNIDATRWPLTSKITRNGYMAKSGSEWATNANGSGTSFSASASNIKASDLCQATDADCTVILYVNWIGNGYSIVFNKNATDAVGVMSNLPMTYGVAKKLTANSFSKSCFTFDKWTTNANGSGNSYSDQQNVSNLSITNNGVVTLYAKWNPNTYTIKFDKNSTDSAGVTQDKNCTYDSNCILTSNGFTRTGHSFKNWNTKPDGSGTTYTDGQSVKNLACSESITLYAQWMDIEEPSASIDDGTTLKATTQDVSLKCSDNVGVVSYYWGTDNPTSKTVTYTTSNLDKVIGSGLSKTISSASTYYLSCKDKQGNVGSNSIQMVNYKVNNYLQLQDGSAGTYNSSNYGINGSTLTYLIKNGTKLTSDVYTLPIGSNEDRFMGISIGAASSTAVALTVAPSKYPNIEKDKIYSFWFNRNIVTVQYNTNGGIITTPDSNGYLWRQSGDVLQRSVDDGNTWNIISSKVLYGSGASMDLANYNNSGYIHVTKTGYVVSSGDNAWICYSSNCRGGPFSHNGVTIDTTKNLCDASSNDCTAIVKVNWVPVNYTIGYSMNNGSFGSNHPTSAQYNQVINIDLPSKTVTFKGNKNSTSGANGSDVTIGNNTSSTISFDGWTASGLDTETARVGTNDSVSGTWADEATKVKNSIYFENLRSSSGTVTLTANWTKTTATLPTVTKSGYTCGWSTSSTGKSIQYDSGGSYEIASGSATTINLYAVCTGTAFKVAYNANATGCYNNATASGTVSAHNCSYNGDCSLKSNSFKVDGCTFTGWKKSNSGSVLAAGASIKNAATGGTVTYYAQWRENICTLNFNSNGGTFNKNASDLSTSFSYKHANLTSIRTAVGGSSYYNAVKTGYTAKSRAEWINTTNSQTYNQAGGFSYGVSKFCPDIGSKDQSVRINVNWVPNTFTVAYNKNGGTGTTASHTCTYDGACVLANNNFTRTGYTFSGWKKDNSGGLLAQGKSIKNATVSGTVTYYAQWTPNVLSVKFNSNGGTLETVDTYDWYLNKWGNIVRNGSVIFTAYKYDNNSIDLPNYNNSSWINFVKPGYKPPAGKEWFVKNGTAVTTFSQDAKDIKAKDLASASGCNLGNGDCTVALFVNWEGINPTLSFSSTGGTYYSGTSVTITCSSDAGVSSLSAFDNTGDSGYLSNNGTNTKSRVITLVSTGSRSINATCTSKNGKSVSSTKYYTIISYPSSGGGSSGGSSGGGSSGGGSSGGSSSGGGCFLAGTKVLTSSGYKDIDKITSIDRVLSYNEKLGINEYQRVNHLFVFDDKEEELYKIVTDNTTIEATQHHRFYVAYHNHSSYVAAKDLNIGDVLKYVDGSYHKIVSISHHSIKRTVYNLEVENNHNFYVGENGILVHNMQRINSIYSLANPCLTVNCNELK